MEINKNKRKFLNNNSIIKDILCYINDFLFYCVLRLKQIVFYLWAFSIWVVNNMGRLKDSLVKRMFWGRSTFYRSAFQFSVGFITIIIALGGLAGRLNLFVPETSAALIFPGEYIGDADYLDEGASMQAVVANASLSRGFDVQKYIVQRGDTLSAIAEKFGVSSDTIRWANGITGDYLKVGQELEILPINGVIHEVKSGDNLASIAEKYNASEQDIYDINWLDSDVLKEGQELLVPNGRMPQPKPVVQPSTTTASTGYSQPAPAPVNIGGGGGTGAFIRPCAGGVTNYFSVWHAGVDIAQAGGTTIYAADSGVVTMARWYGAGGLQIIINHGNGFVTLYAHHSAIYVKEGQTVTKGQPIGYMGCTGRCTGTHLHFGVQRNGVWVNPYSYVPL